MAMRTKKASKNADLGMAAPGSRATLTQMGILPATRLRDLRNIGKAMCKDFELLGIASVAQLAGCSPDDLYTRIQQITGSGHDPCVWDTFAAAIHQAETGEALPWWAFTTVRKARAANGTFSLQRR